MPPTDPVSGGCFCGAVRYEINFGGPSGWPPKTHTCQCTQCRKRSGALIAPWIDTTSSRVLWICGSRPTAKTARASDLQSFSEFSATPGVYRGFCKRCGSPLTYRSEKSPEELEIMTGTVDGEVLAGEMGRVLGKASEGHFWCANFIEGVTDLERGMRFRKGEENEVVAGGGEWEVEMVGYRV